MTAVSFAIGAIALAMWQPRVPNRRLRAAQTSRPLSLASHVVMALALGAATTLLLGSSSVGIVVGIGAAALTVTLLRRNNATATALEDPRELPRTLEVAALLLETGSAPDVAISAAARTCGRSWLAPFERLRRNIAAGDRVDRAWSSCGSHQLLAPVAQAALRSSDSGAVTATAWRSIAREVRASTAEHAEARVQRVGVKALAPLGLCFLPSFICLGVVPIVIGLADDIFR